MLNRPLQVGAGKLLILFLGVFPSFGFASLVCPALLHREGTDSLQTGRFVENLWRLEPQLKKGEQVGLAQKRIGHSGNIEIVWLETELESRRRLAEAVLASTPGECGAFPGPQSEVRVGKVYNRPLQNQGIALGMGLGIPLGSALIVPPSVLASVGDTGPLLVMASCVIAYAVTGIVTNWGIFPKFRLDTGRLGSYLKEREAWSERESAAGRPAKAQVLLYLSDVMSDTKNPTFHEVCAEIGYRPIALVSSPGQRSRDIEPRPLSIFEKTLRNALIP